MLVSAPTGTGKTLAAFLLFIDRLNQLADTGELKEELYLLYISPLKSLAGDIRENLRRPLDGIPRGNRETEIQTALRTGDTPQKERQRMVKHPPHILITTPESLYLMLTSKGGQSILRTVKAVIIDELHALIDTKRGAHLMLSIARLDVLCGRPVQRIGLSATIEPLDLAAAYLSPEPAVIAAPSMEKKTEIKIIGTVPYGSRRKDPVWEELSRIVYEQCLTSKSVIAFSEGRRYAEKLAYYVNLLGGEGFARVHHGSLSKEQRQEVEQSLRDGTLRLLCATSSMELGIDVGDIDHVLQIGCPRTVSSTMQRLGRAGHNPGRVSIMYMYPRTASESVYCGMTARLAVLSGIEQTHPPRLCFDVLAQHLVSMAATDAYSVDDVMNMLSRACSFREVTRDDVQDILKMLAGDYEHDREIPVRPRVLYDRIHGRVTGDPYSRMLAVAAGGTIPDKGLYTARTEDGVRLGELDEEFVYESQLGDRFLLGSFAWRITGQDKDTVIVTPAPVEGARLPFWKGEIRGRSLRTSLAFGQMMRELGTAVEEDTLMDHLKRLGLDDMAAGAAGDFLKRQVTATGGLPDDRTILIEHFTDHTGSHQIMVHALLGKRVNAPLSLLLKYAASVRYGMNLGCVDEEDGFLLYAYGDDKIPENLFEAVNPETVRSYLEAALPDTQIFSMTFRYNAARALMMGMRQNGRQPLWMQRLKSTEMLDRLIQEKDHPLIRETRRECLEDIWDIDGVLYILHQIRAGIMKVREVYVEAPSPMSLPLQWQTEAAQMYEYAPSTPGIRQAVYDELRYMEKMKPVQEELERLNERRILPRDPDQLHSQLMMEGDLAAGESDVPVEWLEQLADRELAMYIEPGLWIAAEHSDEYERAWTGEDTEAGEHIVRRMLYYRGGQSAEAIQERYFFSDEFTNHILQSLCEAGTIVKHEDIYYHEKRYESARNASIRSLRMQTRTQPGEHYAALMARQLDGNAPGEEALKFVIGQYCGCEWPVRFWEEVLFRQRVKNYSEAMLDRVLAQGDYFWKLSPEGTLSFYRYEEIDWDREPEEPEAGLSEDEMLLYRELKKRGASFLKFLTEIPKEDSAQAVLLRLAEKGLVCADSFVPVRQWQNQESVKKASPRQRVNARVMALSAGRWDIIRPVKRQDGEKRLEQYFKENGLLCRETFLRSVELHHEKAETPGESLIGVSLNGSAGGKSLEWNWRRALDILRVWEYTGKVRRGYFVKGLSGAQFVLKDSYEGITEALKNPQDQLLWINAADPAQVWGRLLPLPEGKEFMLLPGTAVALHTGRIIAVMERQGKTLRVFEKDGLDRLLEEFVMSFLKNRLFPGRRRLILKEYPPYAEEALVKAGFIREMQDYVLYR